MIEHAVADARRELSNDESVAEVTYRFQRQIDNAARSVVTADLASVHADLAAIEALDESDATTASVLVDDAALQSLTSREFSPLEALESISALVRSVDVSRDDEAQPLLPMAIISVTEDMATCMQMHAHGWKTAYHNEVLARGLAPNDIRAMLAQRLRWAQGTVQVLLRENPLVQKGLSMGQRLMYFATMWSYFAGFAAVAYIIAPALYLVFGVMPVQAYSWDFFGRLIPFLLFNQLMFLVVSHGTPTWRGQQYSLALFPVWIRACYSAVMNVYFRRPLGFVVTDKTHQEPGEIPWRLVTWQIAAIAMLLVAAVIGLIRLYFGGISAFGLGVNLFWVGFDIAILSVVVRAVLYRSHETR